MIGRKFGCRFIADVSRGEGQPYLDLGRCCVGHAGRGARVTGLKQPGGLPELLRLLAKGAGVAVRLVGIGEGDGLTEDRLSIEKADPQLLCIGRDRVTADDLFGRLGKFVGLPE